VKGGDEVVVLLAAFVVEQDALLQGFGGDLAGDAAIRRGGGEAAGDFECVVGAACVA
jgi:hypothetical protein